MDSERIEKLAIIALKNILYKSELIQADIRRNDKIKQNVDKVAERK